MFVGYELGSRFKQAVFGLLVAEVVQMFSSFVKVERVAPTTALALMQAPHQPVPGLVGRGCF